MAIKYIQVILDDFTDISESFQNTEIFDYGQYSLNRYLDSYFIDYWTSPYFVDAGDVDSVDNISSSFGYFNTSQFYEARTIDSGTIGPDLRDYNSYYQLYMYEGYLDHVTREQLVPYSSSGEIVGHGDWVLDAFLIN